MSDHLSAAQQLQAAIAQLEDSAQALRPARDGAIRAALAEGATAYRVAKTLGLDARQVRNIRDADCDIGNASAT